MRALVSFANRPAICGVEWPCPIVRSCTYRTGGLALAVCTSAMRVS
jgi:hypothetical protein